MSFIVKGEQVEAYLKSLLDARDDGSMDDDEIIADIVQAIAVAARGSDEPFESHISLPIDLRIKHYEATR
ncbi:hypothetical protein AMST5_01458 [freshwater sediment metagenome]|uniref:Uncharacterized protein n=1 Tax=freshwater sediment metagenome TaxID=556182 RepID=A0AA48M1L9_9ZZZZ